MNNYDFDNLKKPNTEFVSYNGTELKAYLKVPTSYDKYMKVKTFELAHLGNVSSFSAVTQYAVEPIPAIGFNRPIGQAKGSAAVNGSLMLETFNQGFVNDVKQILLDAGLKKINIDFDSNSEDMKPKYGVSEISEINEFPEVDLVIIGVKENNPNQKVQQQIQGIRFNRGTSAIGITQLSVREQYSFIAKKVIPFQPVIGAEVEPDEIEEPEDIFGGV